MRVVLIELFNYHSECLFSQVSFWKDAKVDVTLVVNKKLENIVNELNLGVDLITYDFKKIRSLLKLRSFILKNKTDVVILNTIQGSTALKFSFLPFPKQIKILGILHDTSKLQTSLGQKIIATRFNRFYTLGKYVQVIKAKREKYNTTYFNPCYFSDYKIEDVNKGDNTLITIPGSISFKRRSYDVMIELAKNRGLAENVKFVLLGNIKKEDGPQFLDIIVREGLEHRFIVFDQFIPGSLFYSYLSQSDYLLPLIHPETPAAKQYTKNKISGIFPLSQAFGKTMLCHRMFDAVEDFEYPKCFYNSVDECVSLITDSKKDSTFVLPNYEEDKERYLSLID